MSWVDLDDTDDAQLVGKAWAQSSTFGPELLRPLLDAATAACAAYAPALALDELGVPVVPPAYKLAVIQQAREIHTAGTRDGDLITTDAYAARARELTASVRQLLRPKRGRPGVG